MRVVFDTNIFVAAVTLPSGQAARAVARVIDGGDDLLISRPIILELVDVLARKFGYDPEEISRVALFVADLATVVEPSRPVNVLSDPRDNRVLECAVAGKADRVVTGDGEMLGLGEFEKIRIVTLRQYLDAKD